MRVRIKSYAVDPKRLTPEDRFARKHIRLVCENGEERWGDFEIKKIDMDTTGYVPVAKKYHYERVA